MLTSEEQYRYNRHLILDSIGESGQLNLKAAKVLVVGAGGLGCPVLLYLAAAGIGKIGVADFDIVDISNLQRQILFNTEDVGKKKADTAVERLKMLNPLPEYHVYNEKLITGNALRILNDYDIIVDGTDNFETRYLINDACVLLNKVLVYGSVYKMEGQVSVFNLSLASGKRSASYRCLFPEPVSDEINTDCSNVGVVGVLPGIVGTLQATEVIKILCESGTSLANRLLMIDLAGMNFTSWNFKRNEKLWTGFPETPEDFLKMNYSHFCKKRNEVQQLSASEFRTLIEGGENFQIIDVRSDNEKSNNLLPGALVIPFNQLTLRDKEIKTNLKTIVVCKTGVRSELTINHLRQKMDDQLLFNLTGGMNAFSIDELTLKHD